MSTKKIKLGSLRFWNLVAMIIERDELKKQGKPKSGGLDKKHGYIGQNEKQK